MTTLPIITEITDKNCFAELLESNPGLLIIKFGAEWCGPCKIINAGVKYCFEQMPKNVQCAIIDIDKCIDFYTFLKTKRVVNGVPVILCYKKNNLTHIPNDIVIGADKTQIINFFDRCHKLL